MVRGGGMDPTTTTRIQSKSNLNQFKSIQIKSKSNLNQSNRFKSIQINTNQHKTSELGAKERWELGWFRGLFLVANWSPLNFFFPSYLMYLTLYWGNRPERERAWQLLAIHGGWWNFDCRQCGQPKWKHTQTEQRNLEETHTKGQRGQTTIVVDHIKWNEKKTTWHPHVSIHERCLPKYCLILLELWALIL